MKSIKNLLKDYELLLEGYANNLNLTGDDRSDFVCKMYNIANNFYDIGYKDGSIVALKNVIKNQYTKEK